MSDREVPNMYALLVGINCYLPNRLPNGLYYKSLWGCVQDILHVEEFLLNRLNLPESHILKLTSSNGDGPEPTEPREQWPTYENMVAAFRQLTEMAQSGDQVYIHYSGHGGSMPSPPQHIALKGPRGLDEALVPADIGDSEARYLRDVEMAYLLKEMVDKGLMVTVVLDSCHAGGQTRSVNRMVEPKASGAAVRGIGAVDTTARPTQSLVASDEELAATWRALSHHGNGATRAVTAGSGWLLEPQGYVLLAACRANEYANEYPFDGKEKNGALTYWLLDSLKQLRPGLTYKMLHDRILAKVHSQFVEQTPQLQGEGYREVFGSAQIKPQHAVLVMQVEPDRQMVSLNTGQSQGVYKGAQFIIYPPGETDFARVSERVALVKIVETDATESWAQITKQFGPSPIEQGSQAVLTDPGVIRLCRTVRPISQGDFKTDRPAASLQEVERLLGQRGTGFVNLAAEGEPADYLLGINEDAYVIYDAAMKEIPNLRPALNIHEPSASARAVERLVHLSKYRNVRELENTDPMSPLAGKVLVELTGVQAEYVPGEKPDPQPFEHTGHTYKVADGMWTFLRVQNTFSKVLNITVLDLQPDWGISQVYPARAGSFEPLDPGRELLLPLRTSLPPGYLEGTDIIKVFATVGTSSFGWLELPALDRVFEKVNNHRGLPNGPLEELLSAFALERPATRNINPAVYASAEWLALQVEAEIRRP